MTVSLPFYCFMSCLDKLEWKAFLINPIVCKSLMVDVAIKEVQLNGKHNAKCLNFYFYTGTCRAKKSSTPVQL